MIHYCIMEIIVYLHCNLMGLLLIFNNFFHNQDIDTGKVPKICTHNLNVGTIRVCVILLAL